MKQNPVYIIDGARTPFLKSRGKPGPFTPVDLAVQCGRPLLLRQPFPPDEFDEVILGCVNVLSKEMNPSRVAALRLGMGEQMTAFTVQINCGSGMQSVDTAYRYIRAGDADLILAGGAEALSHTPLVFRGEAVDWFTSVSHADSVIERMRNAVDVSPSYFIPKASLESGLTDPIVEMNMGQTAEHLAYLFDISRAEADQYAVTSHIRLERAHGDGRFQDELEPAFSLEGEVFDHDTGVRPDTSIEKLSKLDAAFEPPYGNVTAGNSSQVTDGASWIILASEAAVEKYRLRPKAQIRDSTWSAIDPSIMGIAPVFSITTLLKRHHFSVDDIELWEINEAFAAQILACREAFKDPDFCEDELGLDTAVGDLDLARLNIDGGAISMGHPVGASGNRIVLHLANALERTGKRIGIATECIGGGQAGAMMIERFAI